MTVMRGALTAIMGICLPLLVSGCPTTQVGGTGGGDQGGPVDGGGGGDSNDNIDDGTANNNDNADNTNDNVDDGIGNDNADNDNSDELPTSFRLDGIWDDNGRHVVVVQNGTQVEGNYFTERFCDLENGTTDQPGENTVGTFFDFRGNLSNGEDVLPGDVLSGKVNTCRYGFESGNGWVLADLMLTVIDENTLSGEWVSDDYDGDGEPDFTGSIVLTRQQ